MSGRSSFVEMVKAGRSVQVTALGDSLTVGHMVNCGYFPAFLDSIRRMNPDCEVRGSNHGICGDTARGGLSRFQSASRPYPDLALIQFGINDAFMGVSAEGFGRQIDEIAGLFLGLGSMVALVPPPPLRNLGDMAVVAPFVDACVRVATERRLPFAMYERGWCSDDRQSELWLDDGVHPSERGYRLMADSVLEALSLE